jgi:hypothetical protein
MSPAASQHRVQQPPQYPSTVAYIGQALGAIPDVMFSTVVIMRVLTTLVVPPVLTVLTVA